MWGSTQLYLNPFGAGQSLHFQKWTNKNRLRHPRLQTPTSPLTHKRHSGIFPPLHLLLFTVEFSIYTLRQDFSLLPEIARHWILLLWGPCSFVLIMSAYDIANPAPFWSSRPALYIHTAAFHSSVLWSTNTQTNTSTVLFQEPHLAHQIISTAWQKLLSCVMMSWLWRHGMKREVMVTGGREWNRYRRLNMDSKKCWKMDCCCFAPVFMSQI